MTKKIVQIVERLKALKGFTRDNQVAELLGLSGTALYNHKMRDSVPYEALSTFCEKEGVSLDWLLSGEGDMSRAGAAPSVSDGQAKFCLNIAEEINEHNRKIIEDLAERMARIYNEGDTAKTFAIQSMLIAFDPARGKREP